MGGRWRAAARACCVVARGVLQQPPSYGDPCGALERAPVAWQAYGVTRQSACCLGSPVRAAASDCRVEIPAACCRVHKPRNALRVEHAWFCFRRSAFTSTPAGCSASCQGEHVDPELAQGFQNPALIIYLLSKDRQGSLRLLEVAFTEVLSYPC